MLTARAAALNREVEQLTKGIDDIKVNRSSREIAVMEDPAGLTPRSGPAVTVTLTDAPIEVADDYSGNPNDLVVHQQDIQAVVNAMWRGGAEAVTVQGQRIVSTTGIKCSGNTVQLQGVPTPSRTSSRRSATRLRCWPRSTTTTTSSSTASDVRGPRDLGRLGRDPRGVRHRAGVRGAAGPRLRRAARG